MVREALTNARDHTGAGVVEVVVRQQTDGLVITVEDDGKSESTPEVGTILQRAAAVGGECRAERTPTGTVVRLWLPLAASLEEPSSEATGDGPAMLRLVDLG